MHATFSFLLSLDRSDDVEAQARSCFDSWQEHHCDENNWYELMTLVVQGESAKDHRIFQMATDKDWRGRDSLFGGVVKKQESGEDVWTWSWKFALETIAIDMGISGPQIMLGPVTDMHEERQRCAAMSFDDLVLHIHSKLPTLISDGFRSLGLPPEKRTFDVEEWDLFEKTRHYMFFRQISTHPPFSDSGTPYDYRCFDLTGHGEGDGEPNAILFVDIHT